MAPSFLQSLICLLAGITLIVVLTARYKIHAFFALLISCLVVGLGVGLSLDNVISIAKDGFGNIMKSLGFIIVLGTTLGVVLEYTGSTRVMANYILKKVGERRASLAMSLTGFIVGMPIFCDSGFIVLSGLNKSLADRSRTPMVIMSVSLATGLYSIHCLIPPHPGAAAAAGAIGVEYGRLILLGILVAVPAAVAGHVWARYVGRGTELVGESGIREGAKPAGESMTRSGAASTDSGRGAGDGAGKDPGVFLSFLPVIVPIALIAFKSFFSIEHTQNIPGLSILLSLGDPAVALFIGTILAFASGRQWTRGPVSALLGDAVEKAGSILVIIGAGGAFGAILAATKMGDRLSDTLPLSSLGILFPFLLTAVLKTAQGSSTVAIITAASIVKPLMPALGLATGNGPLLCVLSMGAGSMMLSHANDAYFWVITRFSGLDMKTMLKVYTVATGFMGVVAYAMVYILSRILA
ncbi:MAG TPA: GntP family permease [Puia sp.]|jgi:GntP family gluconate:H+ symporter